MNRIIWLILGLMTSLTTYALGFDRVTGRPVASRSEVIATQGMAATSQPLATQVALDILKAGGSAVDAAIAANATLGLMEPTGCGIGGDLFAIVWDAENGELTGLNASGRRRNRSLCSISGTWGWRASRTSGRSPSACRAP